MTDYKRILINFYPEDLGWLEDQAFKNKREGVKKLSTVTQIVRQAVKEYRDRIEQSEGN